MGPWVCVPNSYRRVFVVGSLVKNSVCVCHAEAFHALFCDTGVLRVAASKKVRALACEYHDFG